MVCIPDFVLLPEPVFDNLYGRGIKAVSSGVSPSLLYKAMLT